MFFAGKDLVDANFPFLHPLSLFPHLYSLFSLVVYNLNSVGQPFAWISRPLKDNSFANKVLMSFQVIFFVFLLVG